MYIHIADFDDNNVRMILSPSADGAASIIRTYTVSGSNPSQSMAFDGTHIHIADATDDNVRMILPPSSGGQASVVRTYTVSGLNNLSGMTFDGTHIHIADATDDNVRMILPPSSGGQASVVYTYTVSGLNLPTGMAFDGTHIHLADTTDDNVRMILPPSSDGAASVVYTYTVSGVSSPQGMAFDGTHIHIADFNDNNFRMILPPTVGGEAPIVRTYTVSGVSSPLSMSFDGGITSQASLTLTTTDADIRAGEAVDIDIASDIDITGFTASDITVTGGTRGALTGSGMSWTLAVTAGSAGTMTIAIAEDAVSPGNTAVSQNFTVTARATATITFDDTAGESGGSTGVNIAFGESVTGLQLSELTASAGTLSSLTGGGTSWEAALAFPATGSGTVTISLAIDSTSPQNASASATIDYAEAADPLVLAWVIPTEDVGNDFSVTLTSNYPVTGVERSDFRLIQRNPTQFNNLTADNSTIVAVAGTNNWRIDFTLDGTYDNEFEVRLVREMVVVDGVNVPVTANLSSSLFRVDSSVGAEALDFGSETIANQAWVVGTAASLTLPVATGGTGAITYSLSPTLPSGKTFTAGTRVLAGTPTGRFTSGTFTYTATDGTETDTLTFTIVVTAPAISFASTIANQAWVVGTAVILTLPTASGGVGAFAYSLSPTTPSGVSFTASTRVLAGNPTGRFSPANFTYTATDAEGITQTQTFTIVATATAITFSPTSFANQTWTVGTAVNLTLPVGAGGVGTLTPSLSPTLPSGVTFTAGTRALAGNPTATFTSATFTYTITDSEGVSASITFTIAVNAAAVVLGFGGQTIANQAWVVGTAVNLTLPQATGGTGTITHSLSPATPAGVSFTAGTRILAGTPTGRFSSATFTYTATDGNSDTVDLTFTIVVTAPAISFASTVAAQAWVVGTALNLTLPTASGGVGSFTYSLTPALPSGITFTASTHLLSGTPTATVTVATYTYTATDSEGVTHTQTFTVVVTAEVVDTSESSSGITGTGIRIGNATEFGVGVRFPRGLASDGTVLLLFDANTGYNLDSNTGIATVIGSLSGFGVSEFALRGATYHNNQFVFYGNNRRRFFVYDPADGGAEQLTEQLTIQGSSVNPDVWGTASIDGTLWALERGTDKLYTVDIANDMLIPVGTATDYGLPGSPNLQSFTGYDGELLSISNGLQRLVQFNRTTGVATVVNDVAVPDAGSEALSEHAGQLFLLGSGADALFRMYDVQWDATIADLEVDEGANVSLDLSTVSDDAASFEFAPTHTARSWLTIVGTTLTVINAPTVAVDTDFSAVVRGVRDGINAEKTLTVKVANTSSSVLSFGGGTIASQSWTVGTGVNLTLPGATGGTGAITYSLSPTLPGGIAFNTGTRVLAGTPTGRFTSGTFTYTATDGDGTTVELTFTIVVTATAISFASNIANQSWGVGTAVSLILPTASGGVGSFTYSLTPALPSGVTFTAATRALSGNPTATATVATYTYTATDSEGVTHTQTFTVVVTSSAITFASTIAAQSWVVGTAVSLTLPTASGGVGAFAYALTGTLPGGVTFTPGTRALAGNPTGRFSSASFTYTATDSEGVAHTQTFTIVVTATAISFASTVAAQAWVVGTAVNFTLPTASGGVGSFTYSLTPTLPAGVTFTASTRVISGTPTADVTVATYTYTATDSEGVSAERDFTIVVAATAVMLGWIVPTSPVGNEFSVTLTSNYPLTGVSLSQNDFLLRQDGPVFTFLSSADTVLTAIAGTNNYRLDITHAGTFDDDFLIRLQPNSVVANGQTLPNPAISSSKFHIDSSLGPADLDFGSETIASQSWTVGTAVSLTLPAATGGTGAITYSLSSTLPAGVTFVAGTRVLSGTPTGRFSSASFTYTATDGNGDTVELTFTIVVTASAITFDSGMANQSWTVGTAVSVTTPTLSGGVGAFTYSITPALPAGVTFTAATRLLSGTPTAVAASATYTYTGTDAEGIAASRTFTIVVAAAALVATSIVHISGNNQIDTVGTTLSTPFTVEVRDQDGDALSGIIVAFAVTDGGGTLSASSVTTDSSGQAESTLTLGSTTGTNTVTATASGITAPVTFTATATATGTAVASYIHISDFNSQDIRTILPPTAGGEAPVILTYRVSGLDNPEGVAFDGTHLHIADDADDNFRMILPPTVGGEAPIVRSYTVSGVGSPRGVTFDGTHLHISESGSQDIRMILPPTVGGEAPIVRSYTVSGVGNPEGVTFDGTHIHISDYNNQDVQMILPPTVGGEAPIVRSYTVSGVSAVTGMASDGTHIHIADFNDNNFRMILPPTVGGEAPIVRTYTVSGVGAPTGMTFGGAIASQATLTLSTTDTDIRAGEAVDINIASNIAISDFAASDVTVTGGTRGALTINSATSATLRVTAGSAGTMTLAIAEDAVSPGNVAVSQDFTVNAETIDALSFDTNTIANQAWIVGTAASLTLPAATGGTGTITYSLAPTLPSGKTFTAGTRVLAGTPTGRFTSGTFTYTATDGDGTTVQLTFTIIVTATAISFASNIANQSWGVGTAVSLILPTASGGVGSFTYSLTPALPSGVTFTAGTRALAGNPTATATVATFTYTATDSEGVTHTQTFTVVVTASTILFASTIANQAWTVGTAVNVTLPTASGGVGAFTYSLSPTTLPDGVTFVAGTRVLSGTPTGRFASATFTYTAEDTDGVTQTQTFTIVVTATAITFSPTSFANQTWEVGTGINLELPEGAGGVGDLTPTLTPSLPSGVTFTASTRALAGNPTATFTSATFTYTMTDAEGESESITFTIVVTATAVPLSFGSETIGDQAWVVGTAVNLTLPVTTGGTGTITYSLSPSTPGGVTFTPGTRVLSGNPTGRFSSASFTYTATDANSNSVSLTFTIVVTAPAITFASTIANQSWTVGTAVNLTLPTASGGVGNKTYSLSPALPSSVTFTAGTRALSGNPTATLSSTTFTYTATDSEGEELQQTFTVVVAAAAVAALSFGSGSIADKSWEVGTAVSLTLPAATGGVGTIAYSLSPTTPSGVTFTAGTRVLAGNPTLEFSSATFTYTATAGTESVTLTFRIVVTDPSITSTPRARVYHSYSVGVNVVIDGQDMTEYLPARAGLSIGRGRDFPNLGVFKSGGVNIPLQNASGMFDPGNPSNFFVSRSLPANGRGAKVLLRITRDGAEVFNIAGEIAVINQSLASSLVSLVVRDLSLRLRQASVENFGQTIVRRITDYEGAITDYDELNPVFFFPAWVSGIAQGSVSLTVEEDGSDVTINVVDAVATTGVLSNRNAEIDYRRGLIRFEAVPTEGANTIIDATWKQDYVYKRPDFLIRSLLENVGIDTRIGITDATDARFAIERALIRHDTDRLFSTHGRPYFEQEGITRWLKRDETNKKMYLAQDNHLLEYDERLDEYELLSTIPEDTTITESPPGTYGTEIADEEFSFTVPSAWIYRGGFALTDEHFYVGGVSRTVLGGGFARVVWSVREYPRSGGASTSVVGYSRTLGTVGQGNIIGIDVYDNNLFYMDWSKSSSGSTGSIRLDIVELSDSNYTDEWSGSIVGYFNSGGNTPQMGVAVTPDRIIILRFGTVHFYTHAGVEMTAENFVVGTTSYGIDTNSDYIFVSTPDGIKVFDYNGNSVPSLDFSTPIPGSTSNRRGDISVRGAILYIRHSGGSTINAYNIAASLNYYNFATVQFDTTDFDSFYCLASNTLRADILGDSTFNRNSVEKYIKSTDTWSTLLDSSTGQPQIAHPNDFVSRIQNYGDNRKGFQVIRRSSKTLIFYRRVTSDEGSISYFNETDNSVVNVRTESYTSSTNHSGIPYSMDFALDERSDGIHVYSFVVKYTATSATLKVFRERVQPSGTETEIFTETFTVTDDYPISVSDVILADDRSKFYFVLSYFNDDDETTAKAELCTIAKDGSGSRTVIKIYNNPLIGARSPLELDGKYYYLEGGWVRLPKTSTDADVPDAEHYYPDAGGRLIEVLSGDTVTDHGVIGRSASKLDSPDPDSAVYDGWGLHNAVVSNMVADDRDNLQFVAGYGRPYRVENNLPLASQEGPAPSPSNFTWIQWGQDLATKIPSFATAGNRSWDAIQNLARAMNWEIGFGPRKRKVDTLQAADSTISDWSANASLFFRPRTILPAKLRTAIVATGTPTSIQLNHSGLPAEVSEFPTPPTGDAYRVLIDKEIFSYTATAVDSQGVTLSGTARAVDGSVAQAHDADEDVFFVDSVIRDTDVSLVGVDTKQTDLGYLYNAVAIRHADGTYRVDDSESIEANGERALSLSMPFLSNETFNWLSLIAARYLDKFKDFKDVITLRVPYSPLLELGQLVVLKTGRGFVLDYEKFEVMRITDNLQKYQTTLILRGY